MKESFECSDRFGLRWFTPTNEVPLCGHATLAAATVLFRVSEPSNKSSVAEVVMLRLLKIRTHPSTSPPGVEC